ncbi:MAG: potassium transporter TrkG [Candidatus Syntrophosphaera sp.]
MNPLDAVVYCFCAISTGGFANHVQSIGYFNSASIEFVTMVLMVLGNLSFLTGYLIFKGNFRSIIRNGEFKVLMFFLLLAIPLLFMGVTSQIYASATKAIRVAVFESVSALTTTGYSTVNYTNPLWSEAGIFMLILLQLVGGGTCSTAGGIKQYRVYMIYKSILWHIKSSLLPNKAVVRKFIWEGDQKSYVNDTRIRKITSFVFMYLALYLAGVAVISFSIDPATGVTYNLKDAMFEFASTIGTVGLSTGITSSQAPLLVIWNQIIGMMLGRLEIFVVFIAIAKLIKDSSSGHLSKFKLKRNGIS